MFWYSKKFTSSRWLHMNLVIFCHKVSEWYRLVFENCPKPYPLFERGPNNHKKIQISSLNQGMDVFKPLLIRRRSRETGFYTYRSQEHRMSSTEHRSNAGTMLVQRLRRWSNIETGLDRVIGVRAGTTSETMQGRRNAIAKPLCRVSARRHRRSLRETP